MNSIKIFRHIACEGPAYLQTVLEQRGIAFELIRIDEGEQVPESLDATAGLIFMGGSMSVNDPLAWIAHEIRLIQLALQKNVPVLGVCLGSQLLAKALGARVYPGAHQCMELGWAPVNCVADTQWARGLPSQFDVFHWHGETFDLPAGATRLFSNALYANQGFTIGPHLALQFHVEMTAESIREWTSLYTEDVARRCDRQHDVAAMLQDLDARVTQLQAYARSLFETWLQALVIS